MLLGFMVEDSAGGARNLDIRGRIKVEAVMIGRWRRWLLEGDGSQVRSPDLDDHENQWVVD